MRGEPWRQGLGTAALPVALPAPLHYSLPAPLHSSLLGFNWLSCSPELLNLVISWALGGVLAEALGGDRVSGESHSTNRASRKAQESHSKRAPPLEAGRCTAWVLPSGGLAAPGSLFLRRKVPRLKPSSPFCMAEVLFGSCPYPYPGPQQLQLLIPGRRKWL